MYFLPFVPHMVYTTCITFLLLNCVSACVNTDISFGQTVQRITGATKDLDLYSKTQSSSGCLMFSSGPQVLSFGSALVQGIWKEADCKLRWAWIKLFVVVQRSNSPKWPAEDHRGVIFGHQTAEISAVSSVWWEPKRPQVMQICEKMNSPLIYT